MEKKLLVKCALFAFFLLSGITNAQSSLRFDGTSDYIQTNFPPILGNNAVTVEAMIKMSPVTGEQLIVDYGSDTFNGGRFTVRVNAVGATNVLRVEIKNGGINGAINLNDNLWHHVAVTYDPTLTTNKYKLFVDGNLDTQGNITQTLNVLATTNMIIGRRINPAFGGYFNGSIDNLRVWNVARSQADINANKAVEFCTTQTNLVAYFKFNNGTPNADNTSQATSPDSSGNNYIATLNTFGLTGSTSNYSDPATLNLVTIDNTVTAAGATLTANQTGATYQWVDCNNADAFVPGATGQSFTPTANGNYAVLINKSDCMAKSACQQFTLGTSENDRENNNIKLYPNPTRGVANIDLGKHYKSAKTTVTNVAGQQITEQKDDNTSTIRLNINAPAGVYFVQVLLDNSVLKTFKVVKK